MVKARRGLVVHVDVEDTCFRPDPHTLVRVWTDTGTHSN